MKTNIINLYNLWMGEKPPTELEFWDKIWLYKRIDWQRTINMSMGLTTEQFKDAYKKHLEEPIKLETAWKIKVKDGVFILESDFYSRFAIVYFSHKNEIHKRVKHLIKKHECILIMWEYYPIISKAKWEV